MLLPCMCSARCSNGPRNTQSSSQRCPLTCRRRHGGQSRRLAAVARGRRPKQPAEAPLASGELSPELAGKESDLMDLLPDPANPPENLLADDSELVHSLLRCCQLIPGV